jgi:hypothetical protein
MEKKVYTLRIDTEIWEKLDQIRMLTTATFSNDSFVSYISLKLYLDSMSRNEVKAIDHPINFCVALLPGVKQYENRPTEGQTDGRTDGPTDEESYRAALLAPKKL